MGNCPLTGKSCEKQKNIQISQNIDGTLKKYNCCQDCVVPGFTLIPLVFANYLLRNLHKLEELDFTVKKICSECGSSIIDLQKMQKVGCPKCYDHYKDHLEMVIPQVQAGAKIHVGKEPKSYNINKVKREMQKAVEEERYEDAAKFRDLIKEFQKEQPQNPK